MKIPPPVPPRLRIEKGGGEQIHTAMQSGGFGTKRGGFLAFSGKQGGDKGIAGNSEKGNKCQSLSPFGRGSPSHPNS